MNYFGSRLDKTADTLNMLFDYDSRGIDLDILMTRISNVQCQMSGYMILSSPSIFESVSKIINLKIETVKDIGNIHYPFVLGDISKNILWNRIESQVYKNEIDLILVEDCYDDRYTIYDSDIAPCILVSKKRLLSSLNEKIIITLIDDREITYSLSKSYELNLCNILSKEYVGSECYIEIYNRLHDSAPSSSERLTLYYSIREQTICSYKMLHLLRIYNDKMLTTLFKKELNLFDNTISALTNGKNTSIIKKNMLDLAKNRSKMENISYEIQLATKSSYF